MNAKKKMDAAERWMRDGLALAETPGIAATQETDMTAVQAMIQRRKAAGERITYTQVFVRAVAVALARQPDLHRMAAGNWRLVPDTVDIGLSVAGDDDMFVTPVTVIRDAAGKSLAAVGSDIRESVPLARNRQRALLDAARRWGRFVPFAWMRKLILRVMLSNVATRRRDTGTFQVSCLPEVDLFMPMLFNGTGILGVGRVRDRVVVRNGQPVVRPAVALSCCADHKVWNGLETARFLADLRALLEREDVETVLNGEACETIRIREPMKPSEEEEHENSCAPQRARAGARIAAA